MEQQKRRGGTGGVRSTPHHAGRQLKSVSLPLKPRNTQHPHPHPEGVTGLGMSKKRRGPLSTNPGAENNRFNS